MPENTCFPTPKRFIAATITDEGKVQVKVAGQLQCTKIFFFPSLGSSQQHTKDLATNY